MAELEHTETESEQNVQIETKFEQDIRKELVEIKESTDELKQTQSQIG